MVNAFGVCQPTFYDEQLVKLFSQIILLPKSISTGGIAGVKGGRRPAKARSWRLDTM
jgi:hypothetical protein